MRELRQANTEKGWDKYMKKITGVWIIGILALIVLAGCGQREQGKEIEKKAVSIEEENKTTIGLSFDSFVIERWLRDRDAFVAAADNLGAEVNVQNANGDVEEQIEQIRYLIKKLLMMFTERMPKQVSTGLSVLAGIMLLDLCRSVPTCLRI